MDSLPTEPQGKSKNTEVGRLSLLQWILPTQELNQGLRHCRQILYQLSHEAGRTYLMAVPLPLLLCHLPPWDTHFCSCIHMCEHCKHTHMFCTYAPSPSEHMCNTCLRHSPTDIHTYALHAHLDVCVWSPQTYPHRYINTQPSNTPCKHTCANPCVHSLQDLSAYTHSSQTHTHGDRCTCTLPTF